MVRIAIPSEKYFYAINGSVLKSKADLISALNEMDEHTFSYHCNEQKNDFANWIEGVFKEKELAKRMRIASTKKELKSILLLKTNKAVKAVQKSAHSGLKKRVTVKKIARLSIKKVHTHAKKNKAKKNKNTAIKANSNKLPEKISLKKPVREIFPVNHDEHHIEHLQMFEPVEDLIPKGQTDNKKKSHHVLGMMAIFIASLILLWGLSNARTMGIVYVFYLISGITIILVVAYMIHIIRQTKKPVSPDEEIKNAVLQMQKK